MLNTIAKKFYFYFKKIYDFYQNNYQQNRKLKGRFYNMAKLGNIYYYVPLSSCSRTYSVVKILFAVPSTSNNVVL